MAATGPVTRLPPEWNYSVTRDGRIFFVNEQLRQTTWLHPLTGHSVQTGYERVKGLPMGWEYGFTPDGDLYFINHNDQRTTFEHPVTGTVSNKKLTFRDYGYPAPETPDGKNSKQTKPTRSKSLQVPAAKRSPDAKITRKGWLHRYESSGMGKKTWKKRWCVLAEYALFFYKDEKEKHSLGSILLPSYRINNCDSSDIVNKAFAFKIEHENTKTCYLAADNIDELNVWLRSVQEAAMLKGSPSFHREHNNNFTNFSKLNNMKLIPKSPIIVQHDDSDDEVPFSTKLSEWEKSWKSPGTYRKGNDHDLSPPQSGGAGQRYPNMDHPSNQPSNLRGSYRGSSQFPSNEDPSKGLSGSDDESPRPGNLQRWHNEPLRESNRSMDMDPRYSSMASDRSDVRQQRLSDQYRHNESQGPYGSHNNDVRGSTRSNASGFGNRPDPTRSRDQFQRMSYDGTYSPKRAEDERNMPNKRDFPGRFIDTAYHPSLQNLPGPVQKPIKDDRIFPEFQDRTQSQPNLARPLDDHHRFQKPIYSNHSPEAPVPKARGGTHPEQQRPPIAAPRMSRNTQQGNASFQQNPDPRASYSGSAYDRGSFAKSAPANPRDSSLGVNDPQFRNSGPRDSYSGDPNGQRNSFAGQRNSFHGSIGQGGPRDSYSGSVGQRNSFHGDHRGSYVGDQMGQENFQRDRNRESYASNRQRDSYSGNRNSQNFQDPRTALPPEHEMSKHPVAAPRSSLSPNRNPGLTIDIPPNYINLPPGSHPSRQQPAGQDEGPHRPPYPAAMRQDVIKELAQNKTPRTSQQYLTSAENEMRRMQQSPYFQYPTNHTQQNTGSKNSLTRPADAKDNRWEDNSARELRAAYERVQQLQHQKPNDPNKEIYGTVNKKKPLPRKTNLMQTVKEDPNMSDKDILTTTEIKNLNKKYPLNGTRVRMSISANDLIGKNHDELVLLLIQLRRNQAALEKARDFYKVHLETRRITEKEYRKQRQNSPGYMDRIMEEEHKNYTDLRHQMDEIENKLEVYRPIINLVDNMVTMGSLYGGDNLMLATQYRKHLLHPDEYIEPKDMIRFSRQRQENKMVEDIENEIKQLTDEEVDLEEKLERLYELDRRLQEQSFLVTSFSDDKEMMERTLQGILNQQEKKRDDPREMRILMDQQRTIERELSRVTQQLAEASRLLEETTAENNKVEHEVALLRTKVHGDLQRSRSAPSLVGDNEKTKRKMENELAKVQNMMSGLSKEGERLQEAMKTIRRSSSGAQLSSLLDDEDNKPQKKATGYMQTDLDTMESVDISKRPKSASSMPDINAIQPETNTPAFSSNYMTMSSPLRSSLGEHMDYVDMQDSRSPPSSHSADLRSRSKSLNELSNPNAPAPPPRDSSRHPLISHQRQQSSVAPPSEMYNRLGDGDEMWDISDAGDNTKRFYGLIPREKSKALTVRDVKRQSEQRREREKTRRGPDDLTDDESRWSLAEGNEPINISHMRYPSDSTGSMLSSYAPDTTQNGQSQPLYENLPRTKSVPNMASGPNVPRRSSSIGLMAPKPFTPYHKRTPSSQSSESSQPMQEVELPGFMQKKVSTLSSSKPFYSEMDIQTYSKPGAGLYTGSSDNITANTYNDGSSGLPWLKSGSQMMGNVLNVNKNPRGRYTTISSSEPVKREQLPLSADTVHNSSAGDLASNKSIDEVPDVVKSSTSQVNKIDEYSIDDILRGPQKVLIPERYIPDSDDEEENLSQEEVQRRQEKAKKIKKILAQQSVHSMSQPDVSRLDPHEKAQQEKALRTELLDVGQELAIQAKRKSKKDAAERRKTWSGGQFADFMAQIPSSMSPPSMVQDLETSQLQQRHRQNILV